MGFLDWLKRDTEDEFYHRDEARKVLRDVRAYCRRRYGDDVDVLYVQVGKRLQYHIDAINNQGGLTAHNHALARWQIYKALFPEYISDKPPNFVKLLEDSVHDD